METRSFIRHWTMLGISVVFSLTAIPTLVRVSTAALSAQTGANGATKASDKLESSVQEAVPPDHYDSDDARTWPDVVTEDRAVTIREQRFTVHFYRPRRDGPAIPAIYACGDGGWRGLAPRTAEQLAHMGFAVAGIDSKVYLRDFSSVKNPLTIKQLARDYADAAQALRPYAKVDSGTPVYIYGWSLGAGFAIAVGSDAETRANWAGIISIGLPKQNQLVSGVVGNYASLNDETNAHFGFRSQDVIPSISPIPLVMIESTTDTASPQKVGRALFAVAREPKRYILINASNHRFSGGREEFYAALDTVAWMHEAARAIDPEAQKQKAQN